MLCKHNKLNSCHGRMASCRLSLHRKWQFGLLRSWNKHIQWNLFKSSEFSDVLLMMFLLDPDTSLHCGGCTANRWSSTCWEVKKESTCSVKPFRWIAFFHMCFLWNKTSPAAWVFFSMENNCIDNNSVRTRTYFLCFFFFFYKQYYCLMSGNNFIVASGTFRVTWRHRSTHRLLKWSTLITIKMWKGVKQKNCTVSSSHTSASSLRSAASFTILER